MPAYSAGHKYIIACLTWFNNHSCHILPFQPTLWNSYFPSEPVKPAKNSPSSISEGGRLWQVWQLAIVQHAALGSAREVCGRQATWTYSRFAVVVVVLVVLSFRNIRWTPPMFNPLHPPPTHLHGGRPPLWKKRPLKSSPRISLLFLCGEIRGLVFVFDCSSFSLDFLDGRLIRRPLFRKARRDPLVNRACWMQIGRAPSNFIPGFLIY